MGLSSHIEAVRAQIKRAGDVFREEGLTSFAVKSFQAPALILRSAMLRKRLGQLEHDDSRENQLDFVFSSKDLVPFQVRSELAQMLQIVHEKCPRTIVEIGTANGGTLYLLCHAAHSEATIASLDLPAGKFGGGYSAWKMPLYRSFARKSQTIHLLLGDSHAESSFESLAHALGGRQVDFLFIDADHTYEGVKRDFELYSTLVAEGGLIGFHDIAPVAPTIDYGVRRFWEELKPNYKWQEIIDDPKQRGFGIGLLQK
jgi:predicted O-methyltransferase YrrM